MDKINLNGLPREEARKAIIKLPRNEKFWVDDLNDGRKVYIHTDGTKPSKENGKVIGNYDITIHYDGEEKPLNYIDDFIVDILRKREHIGEDNTSVLIEAIRESIQLIAPEEIMNRHPQLQEIGKKTLPGHSVDFLLRVMRYMALQEDVNYWGKKPSGKRYEGRDKPYNALKDLFIDKKSLYEVIKKHQLFTGHRFR